MRSTASAAPRTRRVSESPSFAARSSSLFPIEQPDEHDLFQLWKHAISRRCYLPHQLLVSPCETHDRRRVLRLFLFLLSVFPFPLSSLTLTLFVLAKGEHRCRWCGHKERHQDREQRYCPSCLTRTDGTGKPIRGRLLWPKALPLKMRFHDLRHTFATELLRQGVDVHRLMRHSDVRVTTGTHSHLLVEDLRAAVDAYAPKPSVPPPAE